MEIMVGFYRDLQYTVVLEWNNFFAEKSNRSIYVFYDWTIKKGGEDIKDKWGNSME